MSDEMFGPVPEMPRMPTYPTPWEVGGSSAAGDWEVLSAVGYQMFTVNSKALAEGIVKAMNKVHQRQPEVTWFRRDFVSSEPSYYRFEDGILTHTLSYESKGWETVEEALQPEDHFIEIVKRTSVEVVESQVPIFP